MAPHRDHTKSNIHVTNNGTRVFDAGADSAPMVVVYRGLGPEAGADYNYDTASWILQQIIAAIPKDTLEKIIFAVADDYTQPCKTCIQEATELVSKRNGTISSYSICGFSKGGAPLYKNLQLKDWKIVGLIDPVTPTMESMADSVVDGFASRIRCVYGVTHWGKEPLAKKLPKDYTKSERGYTKTKEFYDHLKDLKVTIIDADSDGHSDTPGIFFKNYGSAFL